MTTDRVFVLMMVVLLMMSGCFGATTTTEAQEEQESTNENNDSSDPIDSGSGTQTNSGNGANSASNAQERTWYSSGGVYIPYWTDGQNINNGQERCVDFGPVYNSSTGEYMGEDCREFREPRSATEWNTSMCSDYGGTLDWSGYNYSLWSNDFRNAPECVLIFNTISTSSGEALLIYQASGFALRSTCNGISDPMIYRGIGNWGWQPYSVGNEYNIVPNSAFDCTHELYRTIAFDDESGSESLWSIVYAIQDTTVV